MNSKQTESSMLSPQFLRKRKMMLVYPLLVLPFVTMIFWALGGGRGDEPEKELTSNSLNMQLPNAHLKDDKSENKLSYYEEADKNSVKVSPGINNEEFLASGYLNDSSYPYSTPGGSKSNDVLLTEAYADRNEQKVYEKLAELNKQINASSASNDQSTQSPRRFNDYTLTEKNNDVEKLDHLVQTINTDDSRDDPEMKNLNSMMDKILDIQHPERVQVKQKDSAVKDKTEVFTVINKPARLSFTLLDTIIRKQETNAGFFGLTETGDYKEQNAIEAVVHDDQTLVNGAVIKLRLVNDISVNGNLIAKGNFIFGTVSLNGERLEVEVSTIKYARDILPIKLNVYDMDGLPGIYIPGAITRDVAKGSIDNATQLIELSSMDPSLKAQATSAGISTMKALLSSKAKMVRVMVKAGYKVLLK